MKVKRIALAGASAVGLALGSGSAVAQQSGTADKPIEEIVVVAPRVVAQREHLPFGREQINISYAVSYADLDLRKTEDSRELQNRIREAADDICEQLESLAPHGAPSRSGCVREATQKAMADAKQAIDAAIAGQ